MEDAATRPEIQFVLRLGRSLHRFGAPAHRLEQILIALSARFGLEGQFFTTPTAIFSSFEAPGENMAHLQRIHDSNLDLARLAALDRLFNQVIDKGLSAEEGLAQLEALRASKPTYGPILSFLGMGLTGGAAARFLGGGWPEITLTLIGGTGLATLHHLGKYSSTLRRLFQVAGPAVVAFLSVLAAGLLNASADIATMAGLIVLVPGFTLTIAATELAMQHLVAGTARMAGALMTFLLISAGVVGGTTLGTALGGPPPEVTLGPLPEWTLLPALVVAGVSLGVLFQAPRRDLGWVILAVVLPYATLTWAKPWCGEDGALFAGALTAGIFSNLYARFLNRPAVVTRMPGMLVLVPGALGFLSISSLMEGELVSGLQAAFRVLMTATLLVTGFLVSNLVVEPRKAL